jgi:hypothetical protein
MPSDSFGLILYRNIVPLPCRSYATVTQIGPSLVLWVRIDRRCSSVQRPELCLDGV